MADLNKFQRSKERINEVLNYLMHTNNCDQLNSQYVKTLQQSIEVIDEKMEQFKKNEILRSRR